MRAVVIRLLNADATQLQVAANVGVSETFLKNVRTRSRRAACTSRCSAGKRPGGKPGRRRRLATRPAPGHELTDEQLHMEQLGGFMAIPLAVRERVFGSLDIYCTAGCGFSDTAVTVLHASADLAAVAIENARLHSSAFPHRGRADVDAGTAAPAQAGARIHAVMEMNLKAASVRLLDKKRQKLELVASHGLSESYLAKGAVSLERSRIDQRVLAGETVILYDVAGEEGFQYQAEAAAEGIRSVLAVPLRVKEQPVGVMRVYSAQPRHFTQVGVQFLQSVAGLVAVAIENARLYEALQARYEGLKVEVSEWRRFLSLG